MDRDTYMKLAQRFSTDGKTVVLYDGSFYYPARFIMDFDKGTPINKAGLVDKNKNSMVETLVEKVEELP